jgi:hypothetical protein
VTRYKVRYVAKGYAQQYGIDYDKTTAPTTRLESFRTILHVAASQGWDIQQIDIKTAFLHGILPDDETAYLEQPPGFEEPGKESWVMRLMKSIYGMRQAGRIWNHTFDKAVKELGFRRISSEWCVYCRDTEHGTIIFVVHVDDIISAASVPEENARFKDELRTKWDITDLRPAKFALGIAIDRDETTKAICISQMAFIDRILERFNQSDAHPVNTPMVQGCQIRRPDKSAPISPELADWVNKTPYRELVGSLNYVAIATRPDIAYAVGRLASVLDCYRPDHWSAAIRVLRYLKGTRTLRLALGGHMSNTLSGYSDSDYANCPDTSRSIAGYCFSLGSGVISWRSKKQDIVADSSCYAEYVALHGASNEAIFLRQLLQGIGVLDPEKSPPTHIFCDNDAAVRLTQDSVWHSNTKHFHVKYHSTRDEVAASELTVLRVPSTNNVADILTKALSGPVFERLRSGLGLRA